MKLKLVKSALNKKWKQLIGNYLRIQWKKIKKAARKKRKRRKYQKYCIFNNKNVNYALMEPIIMLTVGVIIAKNVLFKK